MAALSEMPTESKIMLALYKINKGLSIFHLVQMCLYVNGFNILTIHSYWTVNPSLFLDSPTPDSMNHTPAFPACEFLHPFVMLVNMVLR